ncbi:uncharacterized protein PHALS_06591 [Plasmopara halstedii]|uniref:Uncharacterized protein n=1 Tax=Plasmopara halstedii TaxID=4781 RepID=A0A0P1B252_PLAHL|nr:uncharacterized protein PHALS_06591 [Plasmopara halstedii]CEG48790.1 hypothetical protein PHALS_06591 [Plasmopara halstedii]|eukprot:XP_024585159.1 hypothetical protein PHALS_06591 [Plasmopara halstedii]
MISVVQARTMRGCQNQLIVCIGIGDVISEYNVMHPCVLRQRHRVADYIALKLNMEI